MHLRICIYTTYPPCAEFWLVGLHTAMSFLISLILATCPPFRILPDFTFFLQLGTVLCCCRRDATHAVRWSSLLPADSSRFCSGYLTAECDFTVGLPVPYRSVSSDKLRARCQFLHRKKCQSHYVGKYVVCFSIQSLSFVPSLVL